jgi:hypothetical protein
VLFLLSTGWSSGSLFYVVVSMDCVVVSFLFTIVGVFVYPMFILSFYNFRLCVME